MGTTSKHVPGAEGRGGDASGDGDGVPNGATALDRGGRAAARVLVFLAGACLLFMILVVVADVGLRAVNPEWRIFGMLDYVELSLDALIFLAIPAALFERRLITVDLIDAADRRGLARLLGAAFTLVTLVVLGTQVVAPALEMREWDERTFDLGLAKFWYWMPIWVGVALGVVAAALLVVHAWGNRPAFVPGTASGTSGGKADDTTSPA